MSTKKIPGIKKLEDIGGSFVEPFGYSQLYAQPKRILTPDFPGCSWMRPGASGSTTFAAR
jgi:hypothetical protein